MTAHLSRRSLLGLVGAGAGAYLLSGCSDDASDDPDAPQTINWWHIQNTEPMLPVWAAVAQEYQGAHSNVKIEIQPLENEAFKAKLTTATQAGSPPDLFQSWGGGVLKQQVDAGLVKDLTETVAPWKDSLLPLSLEPYTVDGKIYGVPFDIGMVGFWYNKDLFAQAPDHRAAGHLGRAARRGPQAQGRRDHPGRAGRQGQVAGPLLLGLPVHAHRRARRAPAGRQGQELRRPPTSWPPVSGSRSWSTSSRSRRASWARSTARRTGRPRRWATAVPRWS